MPNRAGVGIKKGVGEGWKIENLIAGVRWKKILFDTLKQNTMMLKCFELQMIDKTHQVHP